MPLEEEEPEEIEFVPEEKEMPIEEPRVEIPIEAKLAEEAEFVPEEEVPTPEEPAEEEKPVSVEKVDLSALPPHEAFAYALEEMQDAIKAEFKAIRTELKLWREGQ